MSKATKENGAGFFAIVGGLLRPYVGPQVPTLVTALLLGVVTATAQGGALTLLIPLWEDVLFPAAEAAPPSGESRGGGPAVEHHPPPHPRAAPQRTIAKNPRAPPP